MLFRDSMFRVWPFAQTVNTETIPQQSHLKYDELHLVALDRECHKAEEQFNQDWKKLAALENDRPFRFYSGDCLFIQTRIDDMHRQLCQRDLQKSMERRNALWAERAELLRNLGRIR